MMNALSSNKMKSLNIKSDLYSGGSYLSMQSDRRHETCEPDVYSDVSVDTSVLSHDDTWYAKQGSQNHYSRSDIINIGSSYMQYGSTDVGDEELGRFSELYNNSWYSDDEMSDLLPFDDSLLLSSNMLDEQEELRYFTELVYQDFAASGFHNEHYMRNRNGALWNDEASDIFYSPSSVWNSFDEDERVRRERPLCQDEMSNWNLNNSSNTPVTVVNRCQTFYQTNKQRNDTQGQAASGNKQHPKMVWRKAEKQDDLSKIPSESRLEECGADTGNQNPDSDVEQRIFLGGLPLGMTERGLRQELAAQGYKILKRPKIIRGFAPQVLMRSVDEAKELVEKGVIIINGAEVQVRPFNSFMKQSKSKKIPNVGKRSIFLGGLPSGTTSKDIKLALMKMDIKVVNYPVVKFGYSRQVILETVQQARNLIDMRKVFINGAFVDVRPFINL